MEEKKPRKEYWICAINTDSFNLTPKKIKANQVKAAKFESLTVHNNQSDCQKECDFENSI